ncbi:Cyanovirin-N [Naviculisporaceae sp. PSN 640]
MSDMMYLSRLSLSILPAAVALSTPAIGTPILSGDAVAPSQVPVPVVGAEPTLILGTPGRAPTVNTERDTSSNENAVTVRDTSITKRSYTSTCNSCGITANYLECRCRNLAGVEPWSSLNLNNCLANSNGYLVWRRNGGYYNTCGGSLWQVYEGSWLKTTCAAANGAWVSTEINLNAKIHNQNGVLACSV